jgi:hypothetical protein
VKEYVFQAQGLSLDVQVYVVYTVRIVAHRQDFAICTAQFGRSIICPEPGKRHGRTIKAQSYVAALKTPLVEKFEDPSAASK